MSHDKKPNSTLCFCPLDVPTGPLGPTITPLLTVAPGAAHGAALDAYLDALATAFDALPEDDLAAVVAHVQAVAAMSPVKRAAVLTLTKPEGGAE